MPDFGDVQFIRSSPALDEFDRANKTAADLQTQKLQQQGLQIGNQAKAFDLQQAQAQAPSRLRLLQAQSSTAQTQAQYAPEEARQKIAGMKADVAAMHMSAFTKELDLLSQGDVEGAKAEAARIGDTIPDVVIQNSQVRAGVTNITNTAKQLYPMRPRDQMMYIHAHINDLIQATQNGQQINSQLAPYQQVPGVPQPPEIGGTKYGETEQLISAIMAEHPDWTFDQAIAAAHGRVGEEQIERERLAQNAAVKDPNYLTDPAATLTKWRQQYGLTNAMPVQAPQAPSRPQTVPTGSAYSPSRRMWRDPQGNLYDASGSPLRTAPNGPPQPSVPFSTQ